MLLVLIIVGLLLALTSWLLRRALIALGRAPDPHSVWLMVDVAALKNLLCRDDDVFLKKSLRSSYYRIAKRARTRALQQYLLWIASGCSTVQLLLRSRPELPPEAQRQAQSLSAIAFRLRITSLGFWTGLWFQQMFPQVDLMPASLITAYETLADNVSLYLTPRSSHTNTTEGGLV